MNIVIDSIDLLERHNRDKYQNFLNEVQNHIRYIGGTLILRCYKDAEYENRFLTEAIADLIIDIESKVDGTNIEHYVNVPQYRQGSAFNEQIKPKLTDAIQVDTSRDIA